jgi:hypothetical protein
LGGLTRLLCVVILGVSIVGIVAAPGVGQAQEPGDWLIARDGLNLRAAPSADASVLTVMPDGARVEVVGGGSGDWLPVRYAGQTGYTARAYLGTAAAAAGSGAPATAYQLNLPVPFYRQLTAVWCDPAIIQSWYEFATGRTAPDSYAFQAATWEWEAAHNLGFTTDEWNHSPYALASALHHHMPDRGFSHWKADDATAATKVLAWFLANPAYRQPGIALIWRGAHYVLVRGVEAEGDPYRDYPHATIRGVWVMDPNQGDRSWLGTDRYIPMGEWTSRHLTPVSYLTPHTGVPGDQWQGKHVTILADWRVGPPLEDGRTPTDLAAHLAAGER